MLVDQALVDRMIQNQQSAIRSYGMFAGFIVVIGVLMLIFGPAFAPEVNKIVMELGGGFVGTLSALPIKEVISRREKIGIFQGIKLRMQACTAAGEQLDEPERKRIDDLLWQVVQNTALA